MGTPLDTARSQAVVEARLGRPAQDMFEAAVVLEAWAGVPAKGALEAGRQMTRAPSGAGTPSRGVLNRTPPLEGLALEAVAFVASMIAIACWAAPLSDALGVHVLERALIIALPLTIALQWAINSRYLSRPRGTVHLGRHPLALALLPGGVILVLTTLAGASGLIAGLLSVMWTGGTVLIASRLPDEYVGLVLLATTGIYAGLPAVAVLAGAAAMTTVIAIVAVAVTLGHDEPTHKPGRWTRVGLAGAIGLGIGVLLVADRSVDWSLGAIPALGLLPSTIASFWGGAYLWRFQEVLPQATAGITVSGGSVRGAARIPLQLLAGAIARQVTVTAAFSVLLVFGAQAFGVTMSGTTVLVGFGFVALATLLVGLLEAVGRGVWAVVALGVALLVEVVVSSQSTHQQPGIGLVAGAATVVVLVLPVAYFALSRPATTLATRLRVT